MTERKWNQVQRLSMWFGLECLHPRENSQQSFIDDHKGITITSFHTRKMKESNTYIQSLETGHTLSPPLISLSVSLDHPCTFWWFWDYDIILWLITPTHIYIYIHTLTQLILTDFNNFKHKKLKVEFDSKNHKVTEFNFLAHKVKHSAKSKYPGSR